MDAGGSQRGVEAWSSPAFLDAASEWIDEVLAGRGTERTGPAELARLRHWGAIVRAPSTDGTVWLKAPADATAFEIEIYDVLRAAAPKRILEPLAIDFERGWVLLPDGGEPIGASLSGEARVAANAAAMPRYAELQIALIPQADELVARGVDDMRAALMPARFEAAVAAIRERFDGSTPASDRQGLARIEAERDRYAGLCRELEQAAVPASLDHNDLHDDNVLFGPGGDAADARFYDWGDAVVAHPFSSLLMLRFNAADDPAQIERLRDAYLEPFSGYGTHAELVAEVELACRVGKVARALTWLRATSAIGSGAGSDADEYFRRAPLESLSGVLDPEWFGRT